MIRSTLLSHAAAFAVPQEGSAAADVPAFLDRTKNGVVPANKRPATRKASNGVTLAAPAAATPAPAAKPVKAKAAKVKASKPSTIVRTDANPIKSIVPKKFKDAYSDHNDTCGTKLALALKSATTHKNEEGRDALDVEALFGIAKANGIDTAPYAKLNNGQKRMNVGNKLAGLLKAGKKVTVGKQVFADAAKALTVQPVAAE